MKPYYETELGKLYHGNCNDIIENIDEDVELCLTDFPYGVNYDYDVWDDTEENLTKLIDNVMPKILKKCNRTMLTCGHTNMWKYPIPRWVIAWINPAGANKNSWGFTCWQPVLCYGKDVYLANRKGARQDIIVHNETSDKRIKHSCSKPIQFWTKLLIRGSINPNDVILDPFMGSGTTAVACEKLGRKWVGIELSKDYCDETIRRVEIERTQNKFDFS